MKNLILLTLSTLIGTTLFATTANACIEKPTNRNLTAVDYLLVSDLGSCSNQDLKVMIAVMEQKIAELGADIKAGSQEDLAGRMTYLTTIGTLGAFKASKLEMQNALAKRGK